MRVVVGQGSCGIASGAKKTAAEFEKQIAEKKLGITVGTTGCVGFLFNQKGVIMLEDEDGFDGDALLEQLMEIDGVDDVDIAETEAEVTTAPFDLAKVCEALQERGYRFSSAEVAYLPASYTALNNPDQLKQFGTMLELLEEDDDIQGVWHNLENEEELP